MRRLHTDLFRLIFALPALALAMALFSASATAQECAQDGTPVTVADETVAVEILTFRVRPLTKCELEVEANAWQALVKAKAREISNARVAQFYEKEEISFSTQADSAKQGAQEPAQDAGEQNDTEAGSEAATAPQQEGQLEEELSADEALQSVIDAAAELAGDIGEAVAVEGDPEPGKTTLKKALAGYVADLVEQRKALIDRLDVVLTEFASKGGDRTQYDDYIKAVSGIDVDVTDATATWTAVMSWLRSPEGGIRWAVNFLQFVFIILVFYVLAILAAKATQRALSRSKTFSTLLSDFLVLSARRAVLFGGFFVALSALEVNVAPVLAIVGAAGFVIAFALQNSLSNFASGILMLVYRPFDIGDFVNVGGVVGKVESMNLLSTQLRTPDNQRVIVPNNSVWGDVITNITGITKRRVDLVFGIGYDDDIDKAQEILEQIVSEHDLILDDPAYVVKLNELGDSSVNFVCRPWVKPADYWTVYWDITREVKRRFDAEGVSIPFPQRDVHLYQASDSTT